MLFGSLVLYVLPLSKVDAVDDQPNQLNQAFGDGEAPQPFHELLNALPEETLHAALKTDLLPKYQEGVYQDDRTAVSRVHDENPSLASRLLAVAKLEFVRRQADNASTTVVTTTDGGSTIVSTSTSTPPTSTPTSTPSTTSTPTETTPTTSTPDTSTPNPSTPDTSTPPATTTNGNTQATSQVESGTTTPAAGGAGSSSSSSTSNAVVVPITLDTTDSNGQSTVISTSAVVASASVSAVVPVTTTDGEGSTTVSSSTVAGAVVQTTNSLGQTVSSTVPVSTYKPQTTSLAPGSKINTVVTNSDGQAITLLGVTSGQVIRTHDAQGHTFVTTFTPGGGRISQLVLVTTDAPDGSPTTVTSFVAAPSAVESSDDGGNSGASNTRGPSLQSGLAAPNAVGRELLAVVGAGLLGAAVLV